VLRLKGVRALLVLGPVWLVGGGAAPQEKPGLQIRVQSRLVLVDMIATDGQGRFVADLRPEEIRISEDGREREIAAFDLRGEAGEALDVRPAAPDPRPDPQAALRDVPRRAGVLLAFLLDLNSISTAQLPQVKEAIAGFVRSSARPEDRLMLAVSTSRAVILQPPTRDAARFLEVLGRVEATGEPVARLPRFGEELEILLMQMKSADLDPKMVSRNATSFGRQFIMEEEEQVRSAYAGVTEFVREIGRLPGRKNVLFYSGGYRLKIGLVIQDMLIRNFGGVAVGHGETTTVQIQSMLGALESAARLESYLQRLIEEANRAQVSLYAVDARGLVAQDDGRFKRSGSASEELWREETSQPQNLLRDLASGTGGRWYLNSNDLALGIDGVYRDSARYYEIGYVPPGAPEPGKLHRISLRVTRPGVHVRYRDGYFEPEPYDPEKRAVENAFRFPELYQDFPIRVEVSGQGGKRKIEVLVPTDHVSLVREGERHRCGISVHMALFDEAGNLYGGRALFSKTYRLDYSEEESAKLGGFRNVTSAFQGSIARGSYRLRVVVRQTPAARTATLERRITID